MQCCIRVSQRAKSELRQQCSFRLTSGLFVQWDGGGSGVKAESGLNLLLVLSLALRGFSPGTPVFSFPQKPTFQTPIIKLQQLSMDCTLIDHRNDLTMFKAQVEQQAAGELFHCKVKLKKRKQSAPPSRYFHRLYSYWLMVSTNQRLRNHAVIVKFDLSSRCFQLVGET